MKKESIVRSVSRILLLALIIAVILFIFSNSLKSKDASSSDSEAVGGFIATLFPADTELGAFIQDNLRKIAHFVEFGVLGTLIALYVSFFTKYRLRWALVSYAIGLFVGFIDETLQYISSRGPEIKDVWLDLGGFASFATLVYLVLFAIAYLKYLIDKRKEGENG